MTVAALAAKSQARNGVGAFIKPCLRLEFHYCDWGGSSRGMISFLKHNLPDLARASPSVEIHVSPRPHRHPVIRAHYIGDGAASSKAICVRNMDQAQIQQKAVLLRDASGQKNRKLQGGRNVRSLNESVRGVWSGLHGDYQAGQGVWSKMRKKHMDSKNK